MNKSIKFKNNCYIDSSGIVHNKKTLNNILTQNWNNYEFGNKNDPIISSGHVNWVKIGNLVFLNMTDMMATQDFVTHGTVIMSGLPKANTEIHFLAQCHDSSSSRWAITTNGEVILHYGKMKAGTGATQYYATVVYLCN